MKTNIVCLQCRVVTDPSVQQIPNTDGWEFSCRVGADGRLKRAASGSGYEVVPTYVDIKILSFGKVKTAENAGNMIQKGTSLVIEGRLCLDEWDDKQTGQKRSRLYVMADNFQLIDGARPRGTSGGTDARQAPADTGTPPGDNGSGDDIPF